MPPAIPRKWKHASMLCSTIYSNGLYGHKNVVERLSALFQSRRLPHALLFSGPSGIGKFLVARWIAAAYLCQDAGCGICPSCKKALAFLHPDIHRVEAEEGRRDITISQVRRLSDAVGLKSFEADSKAVIIDDADRMNEESQNAFLKTLEEPPPDTLIILVSSQSERLLPTIRSRCQRFRFNRLKEKEVEAWVQGNPDFNSILPLKLAQGSPGRLLNLIKSDAEQARKLLIGFIASATTPSPVKTTSELMKWAQDGGDWNGKHQVREKLRLALGLGAGLLRDVAILSQGVEYHHLMNQDLHMELESATRFYRLSGLFYAVSQLVDAASDISGYIDPGLAVENVFRIIREMRK
ncbi:MAG: DNA polymerase III subunit delta' [Planctomycetota bacterium]